MFEVALSRLTKRFRIKAEAKKAIRRYGRLCFGVGMIYGGILFWAIVDVFIPSIQNPQPPQPMPWWGPYFIVGTCSTLGVLVLFLGIAKLALWHEKNYVRREELPLAISGDIKEFKKTLKEIRDRNGEARATETQK